MYGHFFKRFFDFFLSLLALLVLSPLLLILTLVGMVAMKGNPFFTQQRSGRKNKKTGQEKLFKLFKFRTMSNVKDKEGNLLPDDIRLNGYGKFLRSTSLDELMELLNILIGDMAVIGPRPQLVRDMVFMSLEQRTRHAVRPGLSGLAQVNGRNSIAWEEKFKWDLKYIEKITFLGDCKIVLMTVVKVLKRNGINRNGTVSDMDFGDWLLSEGKISQEEYDRGQAEAKELLKK